jgi:hypothetical protein
VRQLPPSLAALAAYRQFIVYELVPDLDRPGKTFKYPVNLANPRGRRPDAHDPIIWMSAEDACAAAAARGPSHGVGFTFTEADPFYFIDIDHCAVPARDATDTSPATPATWAPIVTELCGLLPGAAVEISQSGTGLHIIGTGTAPADRRKKDHSNRLFDLYTEKRFVALTGTGIIGDVRADGTASLLAITDKYLRWSGGVGTPRDWTVEPCAEWRGPADDAELIGRAMRSNSSAAAFGTGVNFADLWNRNVDALAGRYLPDPNSQAPFGESEADRALAQHLAFWTGKDCERIERLMRMSALARDKWDSHGTYMYLTITGAIAVQGDVLVDAPANTAPPLGTLAPADTAPRAVLLQTSDLYLKPEGQIEHFAGCVYVEDQHKVLVPGGTLIKADQFRVRYGSRIFELDSDRTKETRDPWEAYTQSLAVRHPRADGTCFRPELAPAALVDYDGQVKANIWWPVTTSRLAGDAGPFLRHLAALLPDERDRTIVLSYMAAVVQHKGYKFQWCPVIQGVEGNGKTLLTRCVAFAVGRRYSYYPKASQIAKQFNDWQYGCIFAGVEDIYVAESQAHVMEELKPMVTGTENEIEGKGEKKETRELCFNLMLNSNIQAAIRKMRNDRRFAMFFTAQQSAQALIDWGMSGNYFPAMYTWLRSGGYAIVNELLQSYNIEPEYNPCVQVGGLAGRAPMTTSFEAAISASLGSVEQEVVEAVEQGLPGFAGGWISSMMFDRLLERLGRANRVPLNKRRDMLISLGYDWHPGLVLGRVNNDVAPDGGKPRLFIAHGHRDRALTDASVIARAYSLAQPSALGVAA